MSTIPAIFQKVPLEQRSFLQKLFSQYPPGNAVREVNNLLASRPLSNITRDDIIAIERSYGFSLLEEYPLNLEEFYAVCFASSPADAGLPHLQKILGLPDTVTEALRLQVGESVYREAYTAAISGGQLPLFKINELEKLQEKLQMPVRKANTIAQELRQQYFDRFITGLKSKTRLSPTDEQELHVMRREIGPAMAISAADQSVLDRNKRYWALENLPLEAIEAGGPMQKGEVSYLAVPATAWQEGDKIVDKGTLYLTNKRVLLAGLQKNSNVRFEKILRVEIRREGVLLHKDAGKTPTLVLQQKQDEFVILLNRLLQHI